MKSIQLSVAIFSLLLVVSCGKNKQDVSHEHNSGVKTDPPADTIKKSIPKEVHASIGGAHVMIKYHAPTVRGRTIWGGLVPYGEVWVTGAHSATSLEIDKDFMVNEHEVAAGKYAIFTIPGEQSWTIIINKNWNQHLADDYDQKDDVVRLAVKPQYMSDIQERLKYAVVPTNDTEGSIEIRWEKVKVELPLKIK